MRSAISASTVTQGFEDHGGGVWVAEFEGSADGEGEDEESDEERGDGGDDESDLAELRVFEAWLGGEDPDDDGDERPQFQFADDVFVGPFT